MTEKSKIQFKGYRVLLLLTTGLVLIGLQEKPPLAEIRNIYFKKKIKDRLKINRGFVMTAKGVERKLERGLALYDGDRVTTKSGTRLEIYFAKNDETVLIDGETTFRLMSHSKGSGIFVFLGRVYAKVKSAFQIRTREVLLAAEGTEFMVTVKRKKQTGSTNLIVLRDRVSYFPFMGGTPGERLGAAFAPVWTAFPSQQAAYTNTVIINNRCKRTHTFTITGDPTPDLGIMEPVSVEVGKAPKKVDIQYRLAVKDKPPGLYPVIFKIRCTSCPNERKCKHNEVRMYRVIMVQSPPDAIGSNDILPNQSLAVVDGGKRGIRHEDPISLKREEIERETSWIRIFE